MTFLEFAFAGCAALLLERMWDGIVRHEKAERGMIYISDDKVMP